MRNGDGLFLECRRVLGMDGRKGNVLYHAVVNGFDNFNSFAVALLVFVALSSNC